MWTEAARELATYPSAVLTSVDVDGYPFSVRIDSRRYDASTGEVDVVVPEALHPVPGPSNLLCHYHDDELWKLRFAHVRGVLEQRGDAWTFRTTSFTPPQSGMFGFMRRLDATGRRYLAKRGLDRPSVNWAAIKEIQRRVKGR